MCVVLYGPPETVIWNMNSVCDVIRQNESLVWNIEFEIYIVQFPWHFIGVLCTGTKNRSAGFGSQIRINVVSHDAQHSTQWTIMSDLGQGSSLPVWMQSGLVRSALDLNLWPHVECPIVFRYTELHIQILLTDYCGFYKLEYLWKCYNIEGYFAATTCSVAPVIVVSEYPHSRQVEQKPPREREYINLPFKMHCDSIITRSCWIVD